MANAEKFLEEIEKLKKKKKEQGEDTSSLDPIAPVKPDLSFSPQVNSFFEALNTEQEKLRRREEIANSYDIAPTVGTVSGTNHGGRGGSFTVKSEEDDSLLDFFDKGAFREGVSLKTIGQAILGTAGDIGIGAVKGVAKTGGGLIDAAQYGAAAVADAFGADEWADDVRKSAQRTVIDDTFAPVADYLDKYSVLGRTMNSATEAVGQIGAILATGGLAGAAGLGSVGASAATMGVMGLSSFGSSTGEAYKGGAETGEAELYGAIAGAADAITELLSGGLGKGVKAVGLSHGLGGLDDIVAKKVSEKITNTIAKNAVQFGVKASGEGLEEVLAGTAQAVGKKLTYMEEEELGQIIADENLLEQFVVGAMASGVAQVPSLSQANKAGTDYVTGRTKNEQAVIDRVVEQRIKDEETKAGGVKLNPKQRQEIEEQAASDMERGRIEIDTIEEVLGGEEYKAYQDAVKEEDALRKEYEELGALKEPTLAEQTRYKELHEKASEFSSDERRTALKKKLSEHVAVVAQGDRLSESYAERARRKEYFTEDVTKYKSDAAKKTVQNLIDSKVANNTNRTRELAETVAKIAEDKGIVFNFTNNKKLRESGKAGTVADGVIINGFKDADGITINIDSPNVLKTVVGHEVTHVLEGTAEYTELAAAAKEYAVTKGEYDSRRDAIASLYAEGTDVDSELTADMVGEYLFTDEQFVTELSTKHQNVFQKVFAEIKHLVKMVTAGSKEARQLEQVKRTFEKAYRAAQQETQAQAGSEYSLARVDGTDYVRAEKNLFVKEDGTLASEREVFKSLVGKKIQTADGEVEIVSRLPGKDMYNELSRRYPKSLGGVSDVKRVNSDVNYNMEELLETSEMKNANEPDKGGRHAAQGIVGFDTRTVKFYDGSRAYDVEFSIATLQDGRKVAYAKKFFGYDAELTKKIQTAESRSNQSPFDQQSVSDDIISQNTENVNRQFSLGYHAGDLGKAEFYHQQGGSRGTGHFGTGTYFVGDEQKISGDNTYGKRPHHAVEFDNYNLYKVRGDNDGFALHDQLKVIDGGFDAAFLRAAQEDKFRLSELRTEAYDRAEKYDTKTYDEETGLDFSEDYIGANIRAFTEVAEENGIEIQSYDEWLSTQDDDVPTQGDSDYDFYKSDYLGYLKETLQEADSARNDGYADFRDAYFNLWLRFGKKNTDAALQAVIEHDAAMMPDGEFDYWSAAEKHADSRATVFMKALGYEGIDTRGTALDNVEYGSVIYDLKGEDAQRKAAAGAKYSLTKDTQGRELTAEQREYFRESKVTDENGNLKVMYHGTPNGDFTVFRDGTYFTDSREYADKYQQPGASSLSVKKNASNPKTFEVYLDIKKPFDLSDPEARDVYINDYIKGGNAIGINPYLSDAEYDKITSIDWTEGEDLREFLQDNGYDYDGLILDEGGTGGYGDDVEYRGKSYVVFSPEQVKNVDNAAPTADPDIRRSLSDASHVSTKRGIYGRDIKYEGEEMQEAAPVRQTAEAVPQMQQSAPVMVDEEPAADDIAPIPGEHSKIDRLNAEYDAVRAEFDALSADVQSRYAEMSPAEQEQAMADVLAAGERLQAAHDALMTEQQSALASYTDADVPPEVDAPYYGEEDALPMPDDPMADRDEKEVGNRSVKAYQYLNPEVKPFFREEANAMLGDLRRSTKGERFMSEDGKWTGVKRILAYDLAGLKDRYGYSYEQLERGIQAIIDDDGKENNAVSKRIELLIHDRLAKGYVDAYSGNEIPANEEYLDFLREKQITEYNDAAFDSLMADAESLIPPAEDVDDVAPVAGDSLAGVSSAVETEVEEIDAPVADTAEMDAAVGEIRSTYDKILAKKQNAEATLEAHKKERAERAELYKNRIDELQRKLDHKKRKDTKAAVKLAQQITRVKELAANVDADYAKRISDAEKRIARRNYDLQQDHTEADKLERAYARIDSQLAEDRAAVEAEFAQRREELTAAVADKNDYISSRAMELYDEITHLKKGVRASYELGYLLDRGYDWRELKSTLLKVNRNPDYVINPDSEVENDVRAMLVSEYSSKQFEIGELDGEMQDRLAELEADAEAQKAEVRKSEEKLRRKQVEERYMNDMKVRFAQSGIDLDELLRNAKNVSGFKTVDKTPQRVNYAVFGDEAGEIMNDLTVNQVAQSETEGIRWLNQYTDPKNGLIAQISKTYHIKPGSKESAAAQMYAEGFYVDEYDKIYKYGDRELAADFPDVKTQAMIKGLAHDGRIRAIYDQTLDAMNEVRVRNGYPEIPKRQNYYLHFREMGDFFSTMGTPFNPDAMNKKDLPTDINGMTVDNRPGKPYFASEHQRKGKRTSFDLLGGLERYLTSAKDQIYQIDNIQTMRALRNYIADDYGRANGLDSLAGLPEEEVQQRIDDVFDNHLSTYAKFLNEEANILAGKTALIDRALEGIIGRRGMTFMTELNKQVGANQVGFNVSSSLTNLLSGVQAFSKMNKGAFIKGFAQTVSNRVGGIFGRGDNFAKESTVMVRREGAKRFKTNWWQRRQDNAYALMGAVDSVMTEVIARAKYTELTGKGMSTEQAHYETDKWVSALMGDRSLGQMPHLFNSKTFGMILKYQLEVRNQLDSMFADTIREAKLSTAQIEDVKKRNAVKAAKIASTFATLAVTQHIFGQVFESIAGYNPAFDIIEAIIKAAGWDDDEDDDDTVLDNLEQGLLSIAEDMPYYSILSGGRIPIESALPIETIFKGKDSYGNEVSRWKTAAESLPYYFLPGGYGQIKKTVGGLGMYSDEHPVAGSYTDSGNLRFPVGTEPLDVAQAAVFGQYSSANARDYFDDERKPLTERQITEYAAADMTIQDYWRYRDGLKEHSGLPAQAEYINSLDIPTWKKNLFINNLTDRKEDIDMADFGQYGSLEEMDFAKKSPEKYALMQEQGVTYEQYQSFDDDTKNAYEWAAKSPEKYGFIRDIGYTLDDYAHATDTEKDAFTWAYNNPDKYLVSRAVSDDLFAYRGYTDALNDIKADKDSEGKSISGSRKDKVIDYINGLDLDYGAKIILLKQEYPAEDAYNYDIIDYLNERDDISGDDMVVMLTALGFKVSDDGTVTWD